MGESHQDPFHLHLELRDEAHRAPAMKEKFEAGEHLWLGMRGAEAACGGDAAKLKLIRNLRRPNDSGVLTYGEIVALSGDFYGSPEKLFSEEPAFFPWWKGSNDLKKLRDAFSKELTWIDDEKRHQSAGYPDNTLTFAWTAKSYLELAEDNTAHFGWHNIKKYCRCHAQAIEFARQAKTQTSSDENWMRALFYNGFADHFLTDAFAAGHIRVPRQQIRDWAETVGYSGKLAGFLSKVLHDQDGHVEHFHDQGEDPLDAKEGLRVLNARGQDWSTRCDGQLFLVKRKAADPLINEPVSAVEASLREVFQAREQPPAGEYAALKYVPFPHPEEPALSAKFSNTSNDYLTELLESFKWYTKLPFVEASLDANNIRSLFLALPELMRKFGESVAADYARDPELQKRLPKAYVEAFKNIR
jgi:hypothetical protein